MTCFYFLSPTKASKIGKCDPKNQTLFFESHSENCLKTCCLKFSKPIILDSVREYSKSNFRSYVLGTIVQSHLP